MLHVALLHVPSYRSQKAMTIVFLRLLRLYCPTRPVFQQQDQQIQCGRWVGKSIFLITLYCCELQLPVYTMNIQIYAMYMLIVACHLSLTSAKCAIKHPFNGIANMWQTLFGRCTQLHNLWQLQLQKSHQYPVSLIIPCHMSILPHMIMANNLCLIQHQHILTESAWVRWKDTPDNAAQGKKALRRLTVYLLTQAQSLF